MSEDELYQVIAEQTDEIMFLKEQLIETQGKLIDRQESLLRYLERDESNYIEK